MKHTIEIEGLPEGYNVESVKITHSNVMDGGIMLAVVNVKRKQPHRIVLEEAESNINVDFYYKCKWWRIVEDSGENDD